MKHSAHKCYYCGGMIGPDVEEVRVQGIRVPLRYMHLNKKDCREQLRLVPPNDRGSPGERAYQAEALYNGDGGRWTLRKLQHASMR